MDLISIIIAIVILGLVMWGVGFLPIPQSFKNALVVICIIFIVIWFLQSMGWLPSLKGGANTIAIR